MLGQEVPLKLLVICAVAALLTSMKIPKRRPTFTFLEFVSTNQLEVFGVKLELIDREWSYEISDGHTK